MPILNNKDIRCPVCGGTQYKQRYNKKDYWLLQCSYCSHGWVSPMPSQELLESHYNDHYFNASDPNEGYVCGYADTVADRMKDYKEVRSLIDKYSNHSNKDTNLLDVGCACGHFMRYMSDAGFNVFGVDISDWAIKYAAKTLNIEQKNIFCGTLCELVTSGKVRKFQVITMLDLLEHVPDPESTLLNASELLDPGGVMIMKVPNISSLRARCKKGGWRQFKPPEHLHYFSPKSASIVLSKINLKIEKALPAGGIGIQLKVKTSGEAVSHNVVTSIKRIVKPLALPVAKWLNWPDMLLIVASKPS